MEGTTMKKIYITLFGAAFCLASCEMLNTTPQAQISPADYFQTETDLQLFSNPLYDQFSTDFFENQSDHYINMNLDRVLKGGDYRAIPASGGGWSWGTLRRINTLLANSGNCPDSTIVKQYNGLARFFRAYFYFEKVKRFGDVPWISKELESNSPELYNGRDSRELVMRHMIEDIDYAIENLPAKVSTYRVNKWAALALKAQFCLFEGTFRKYHKPQIQIEDVKDYKYYLDLAAKAAGEIITSGPYSLAPEYLKLFANVDADKNEYILAIKQDKALDLLNNSTAFATMPTQGCPGLTKKFVDSFLMKDGSRFTDKDGWETMQFIQEVADRDPRLECCTVLPGYKRIGGTDVLAPDYGSTTTGFQICKYVMDCTLPDVSRVDMSYNDLPVYRFGEVLLIYAEAKAEAGTITDADIALSINLLRNRAGMPDMPTVATMNANPDVKYLFSAKYGYQNPILKDDANFGTILEIRRERSIELAQEGKRYDDLMRWKEGKCIEQEMYGPYFPGPGKYDLTGDNKPDIYLYEGDKPSDKDIVLLKIGEVTNGVRLSDGNKGYVDSQQGLPHSFDENRDYLYPIPTDDREMNPKLKQNPGWIDGLSF